MARYIDESKLIQAILKERDKIPLTIPCASYELLDVKPNSVGQLQRAGIKKALRCIAEAPTADVVEVRHGEWDYYSTTMMECSVCKRHTPRHRYEFCPHCGAKMGGKTE
jgi:hypothetical protein